MKINLKISLIAWVLIIFFNPSLKAQQSKKEEKFALTQVLNQLSVRFKVNFLYEESQLKSKQTTYKLASNSNKPLTEILNLIVLPLQLSWQKVDERNYSIFPKVPQAEKTENSNPPIKTNPQDATLKEQVTGSILDEFAKPLEYTTVSLLTAPDSVFIVNAITDLDGKFTFNSVKPGIYKIKVSAIGRNPYTTKPFEVGGNNTINKEPIVMPANGNNLKEVKIVGQRALVEAKRDRFIFNVDNSAMAVGNSLQVLRSAPFVKISSENTVTLQGKKTMVLIDGKPIPDAALENTLQTLPAGNILKIELITQPSAKYDAAFGAVINIITKKTNIEGFTGDLRADGSAAKRAMGNVNASANYKKKNLTLFANGGITKGSNIFNVTSERYQDPTDPLYYQSNNWERMLNINTYSFQASAELKLDKNQSIGAIVNGSTFYFKGPWATVNNFGRKDIRIDSVLNTNATFNQSASSYTYNLNYRLLADSGKNEFIVLGTFTPWQRNLFQDFPSVLYNAKGEIIRTPAHYQTRNKAFIDVYIAQADYTHQFKADWKLETGLKYQSTNSKTSVGYEDNRNGPLQNVQDFSNQSVLKESIGSVYGILSKEWKTNQVEVGLRLEKTEADFVGNTKTSYYNFFPTLNYQHNFNANVNISASYKRTITRAPYRELVPFSVFLNQYNIQQGNPTLKPQFDDIYTLNTNIHKLNLSLSYTKVNGVIGRFPFKQDYKTKVTYFTLQNLDHSSDISLYLFYPFKINNWWETTNSGTPIGYTSAEGPVLGNNYELDAFHSDFKSSHIFKLSKSLKLQIDAYYWTKYVQDLSSNSGYKNIDASLMMNLWEGKGQLRLGGNELVFKRNDYTIEQNFGTYRSTELSSSDSRKIFLGFNYKFGKAKIQKTNKKLGNEEALKRL